MPDLTALLLKERKMIKALFNIVNTWWKFHSFRFQKDVKLECKLFKADEISRIAPKLYNTVYSQTVIWSRFADVVVEEACIYT